MIWLLLFTLTGLAVLWPMLPAILEWARPTDVTPLQIDTLDTLDPPCLARSFALRLAAALAQGEKRLGRSEIAEGASNATWPLNASEQETATSRRVWHTRGDACLPPDVNFLAEVSAQGSLRTAAGRVYRALWAGGALELAPGSQVLRWAHGAQVDVGSACRLTGRVSADKSITVHSDTAFTLLHAPTVRFLPAVTDEITETHQISWIGLPDAVKWDAAASRGTCDGVLDIDPHCAWRGDLVCRGALSLGPGCKVHGSLKTHADLRVGAGSSITGSVIAEGRITLGAGSRVRGSVVSETVIVLGKGCVIGAPGHPATVAAPRILVAPGVRVSGTLWAGENGNSDGMAKVQERVKPRFDALPGVLVSEVGT